MKKPKPTPSELKRQAGKHAHRLRVIYGELAAIEMGVSLEKWLRISNAILDAAEFLERGATQPREGRRGGE